MKSEEIINIEELIDKQQDDNGIYFAEINEALQSINNINSRTSFFTNYGVVVFLTQGSFEITMDGITWLVDAKDKCMLFLHPRNITSTQSINEDLRGYVLGIHRDSINDGIMTMKDKMLFPWSRMIELSAHKSPVCSIEEKDKSIIVESFKEIKKAYQRSDFKFHHILTRLKITELILEILNTLLPKIEAIETTHKPKRVGYKESICNEFIIMAMNHHRTQHTLDFYAKKLHISTQYLTHLVKSVQGMTANKIINDMIMLDAKTMLKLPTKSIKEIAFDLNFADQSSFGKFFKKHTGISASKFRKMK